MLLSVQDSGAWKQRKHTRCAAEGRSVAARIGKGHTPTGSATDEGRSCAGCAHQPGALAPRQSWQGMAPGGVPLALIRSNFVLFHKSIMARPLQGPCSSSSVLNTFLNHEMLFLFFSPAADSQLCSTALACRDPGKCQISFLTAKSSLPDCSARTLQGQKSAAEPQTAAGERRIGGKSEAGRKQGKQYHSRKTSS